MSTPNVDVLARIKEVCVYIDVNGVRGTGYLIGPRHVATARHVVEAWANDESHQVTVGERSDGIRRHATLRKKNNQFDAAILELDKQVLVEPLPVAQGLEYNAVWTSFGFPAAIDTAGEIIRRTGGESPLAGGIPLDGLVKDINAINDLGTRAILLVSAHVSGASLQGFSGAPVVVGDAVIGHLTRFIPSPNNQEKGVMDYVYACPISALLPMLDFEPTAISIASSVEEVFGSEAYFDNVFQGMDWSVDKQNSPPCELSIWVDNELLSLALEQSESDYVRDQFAGKEVATAQANLSDATQRGSQRLASLRTRFTQTNNELREIVAKIEHIKQQRKPTKPVLSELPENASVDLKNIVYRNFQSENKNYEKAIIRFDEAKATLPSLQDKSEYLQQKLDLERVSFESYQYQLGERLEQLRTEIEMARGRDIAALLRKMLRQLPERGSEHAAIQQFLNSLIICSLGSVASPWLGAETEAADQIIKTAESNLEYWIRRAYMEISADLVARLTFIIGRFSENSYKLDALKSTLDAALDGELLHALIHAKEFLHEVTPSSPNSEALVDVREIDNKVAEFDAAIGVLESARARYLGWIESSRDVLSRSKEALCSANMQHDEMRVVADATATHLKSLMTYYALLRKVLQHSATLKIASNFLNAYDRQAQRRFTKTVSELINECNSTYFLTHVANKLISSHNLSELTRDEKALADNYEKKVRLREEYEIAKPKLLDLPRQYWLRYSVLWWWYACAAAVPILNFFFALRFFFDVKRFKVGLESNNQFYSELRSCGRRVSAIAITVSLGIPALWAGVEFLVAEGYLILPEKIDSLWSWEVCATYLLTGPVYLAAQIQLKRQPSGA